MIRMNQISLKMRRIRRIKRIKRIKRTKRMKRIKRIKRIKRTKRMRVRKVKIQGARKREMMNNLLLQKKLQNLQRMAKKVITKTKRKTAVICYLRSKKEPAKPVSRFKCLF